MQKYLFIIYLILLSVSSFAQQNLDKIIKHNGEVIYGFVVEIDKYNIKYRKDSELDATIYFVEKREVAIITYRNGKSETFEDVPYEEESKSEAVRNIFSINAMMLHRTDPKSPSYLENPTQFGFFINWSRLQTNYPIYPTCEFFYYSAKSQHYFNGSFENRVYGLGVGAGFNMLTTTDNFRPYFKVIGGWMYGGGSIQTNNFYNFTDNGSFGVSEFYGNIAIGAEYNFYKGWGLNLELGYSQINKISLGIIF